MSFLPLIVVKQYYIMEIHHRGRQSYDASTVFYKIRCQQLLLGRLGCDDKNLLLLQKSTSTTRIYVYERNLARLYGISSDQFYHHPSMYGYTAIHAISSSCRISPLTGTVVMFVWAVYGNGRRPLRKLDSFHYKQQTSVQFLKTPKQVQFWRPNSHVCLASRKTPGALLRMKSPNDRLYLCT